MADTTFLNLKKCDQSILARANRISQLRWFEDLSHRQTVLLAGYMECYEAKRGTTIVSEGADIAHMVLVASGSVDLVAPASQAPGNPVASIGPGESFGEISLIDGKPHSASAVAATQVSLITLSKDDFARLNVEDPRLGVALLFKVAHVMSQKLRQSTETLGYQ